MKSYSLTLAIITFLIFPSLAQNTLAKIDSLSSELNQVQSDSHKVVLQLALASYYREIDLNTAESFASDAIELSKAIDFTLGTIKALYQKGVINRKLGNTESARILGKSSLKLSIEKSNWHWAGANSNSLGNVYKSLGVYDTAAIYYFKALEFYEKAGLPEKMPHAYNNLGATFSKQNKKDLAIEYLEKALKGYKKHNKLKYSAFTLMNLAKEQKSDSIALDYFNQSMAIHQDFNNLEGIASVKINIGSRLMEKGQFEAATPYYLDALAQMTKVGHKSKMAIANGSLGKIFSTLGQVDKAIPYYEAALELSKEAKFIKETKETYFNLANLYASQENYQQAFEYLSLSRSLADSMVNDQNLVLTSELEAKYDAKQKEATLASQQLELEREKNSKNRQLIFGVFTLLGITFIFQRYYYRQKRKKQEAILALEMQKAEAENLRTLADLKSTFFNNISHELKTPLTLVISPLEEAIKKSSDDNLQLAFHNSKKLYNTVNEFLDLSKLEAGQATLNETAVHFKHLVSRIFYSFQSFAEMQDIQIELNYKLVDDLGVMLDLVKFEKILNNLISNAIKFSNKGDTISLTVNKRENDSSGTLVIKVKDTGIGISTEDLPHIFDRYYQSATGKLAGGTGIGLALSKELALLFGGNLYAESPENGGSTFTLELPLKPAIVTNPTPLIYDPAERFISKENNTQPYQAMLLNGNKPRILIVEDHAEMSGFLINTLKTHYDCHTAKNGYDALNKLSETCFDLITSDVMMPEMDGFELRKKISQNEQWRQIPFIMLTARTLEQDKLQGFNLGVDDYITKPFSSRELLARIENLLKNKTERERFIKEETPPAELPETVDCQLLKQAEKIVLNNIYDPKFKVSDLARQVGYSQRQLTRIIKKLTGLSPVNFILEIRLQKAYQLFQDRQFSTVSEIRYEVGIESAAYFTTKFKARFGKSPKAFLV